MIDQRGHELVEEEVDMVERSRCDGCWPEIRHDGVDRVRCEEWHWFILTWFQCQQYIDVMSHDTPVILPKAITPGNE